MNVTEADYKLADTALRGWPDADKQREAVATVVAKAREEGVKVAMQVHMDHKQPVDPKAGALATQAVLLARTWVNDLVAELRSRGVHKATQDMIKQKAEHLYERLRTLV